jgi:hypothetical protein
MLCIVDIVVANREASGAPGWDQQPWTNTLMQPLQSIVAAQINAAFAAHLGQPASAAVPPPPPPPLVEPAAAAAVAADAPDAAVPPPPPPPLVEPADAAAASGAAAAPVAAAAPLGLAGPPGRLQFCFECML